MNANDAVYLTIPCPICGAQAGEGCIVGLGRGNSATVWKPRALPHGERVEAGNELIAQAIERAAEI